MIRKMTPAFLVAFLTLACALTLPKATPTPTPTLPPTLEPTAAVSVPEPTQPVVMVTPTVPNPNATLPPPPEPGLEAIFLAEPGTNSMVTSPVHIRGAASPTFEQNLVISISGEDGREITRISTIIQAEAGQRGNYAVDVPFTLTKNQSGRISVWDSSPKDGSMISLASVEVNLLASGTAELKPANVEIPESIQIDLPTHATEVSGGTVEFSGFSDPVFENTLTVVICGEGSDGISDPLCGTKNNILSMTNVNVQAPEPGQRGPFAGSIPYTVTGDVHGSLLIYSTSPRDGGILHLSSRAITLKP